VAEIADLYGEGFQPLLVPEDFAQWEDRPMPADVLREQARVERDPEGSLHETGRSAFGNGAAPDAADPRVGGSSIS